MGGLIATSMRVGGLIVGTVQQYVRLMVALFAFSLGKTKLWFVVSGSSRVTTKNTVSKIGC